MSSIRLRGWWACLLGLAALSIASAVRAEQIGEVVQQEYHGAIGLPPGQSATEQLIFQHAVHANEKVETADGGTVLKFTDATRLAIDAHSKLTLDRFVYDPQSATRDGSFKIAIGLLRFTSGLKHHGGDMSIDTPVAVLSIRGTDVIVKVESDGTTVVDLLEGIVDVLYCGKKTTIKAGQSVKIKPGCPPLTVSTTPLIAPDAFLSTDLASFPTPGQATQQPDTKDELAQGGNDGNGSTGSSGDSGTGGSTGGGTSGGGSGSGGSGGTGSGGGGSTGGDGSSGGGTTGGGSSGGTGHTNHSGGSDGTNPGGHGNQGGSNNPGGGKT